MENIKLTLFLLPEKLGICHLAANSPVPSWASSGEFFSITRTDQELSIVYPQEKIPAGVLMEKDWRAFRVEDVIDGVYVVGIIASLSGPLAKAGISIFNISTYETNYILLEEKNLAKAKEILSQFCNIK
ncbi:MAG TPA: ACT domain-containing protein [Candidatus Humimicrobiaceae bacterium]|nr:ACT domain-containing protein [Candidatus Humimicrobiaceae bacterium]